MKNERIQHPYKKDWTCIILKQKCNCPCHTTPGMMHFVACCDRGYVELITDEKPNK